MTLVQLVYQLVTMPELEPWTVNQAAGTLTSLLKSVTYLSYLTDLIHCEDFVISRKRDLLTPDDLSLPWRPLYELYERLLSSPYEPLGLIKIPS